MIRHFKMYIIVFAGLVTAACTSDASVQEETAENGSGPQGAEGAKNDLVVSYRDDLVSLDPHGSNDSYSNRVRHNIYEGLVKQDEDLEPEALLANDWEQVDETTWQFDLEEDVTFHDGSEFNAEVVEANFERILDETVASPRANIYEMVEDIEVIDEHTIEFTTAYPFSPFLNYLTHGAGGIMSKELIDRDYQNALEESGMDISTEEYYTLRNEGGPEYEEAASQIGEHVGEIIETEPSGTNYLQFSERSPGEYTELARFDNYWKEPTSLDTVTFKMIAEAGSLIADLEAGQSHMIGYSETSQVERIENNPDVYSQDVPTLFTEFVGFNTEKEPLNDKRVRQAIAHMFDKEDIIDGVFGGNGDVVTGALNQQIPGYNDDVDDLEYNPEKAKELLEEAGYEDGFELTYVTNDNPERIDLGVYLQERLKDINIDLEVEQMEWGSYLSHADSGEHDLFVLGWPNPTADPDQSIWPLYHSSMHGTQGNRTFYDNEEVDQLLEEARQESDTETRGELYTEVQEILNEEVPAVHYRDGLSYNAILNSVEGIEFDAHNNPDFRNAVIDQ